MKLLFLIDYYLSVLFKAFLKNNKEPGFYAN